MLSKFEIKSPEEIAIMKEGGAKLAEIKKETKKLIKAGISAYEVDKFVDDLIVKKGGVASFKKVPGYYWATCINVNSGIVHGIPKKELIFKKGDLVSVDMGIFYKGFHTDTSISVGLDLNPENKRFLDAGAEALALAIKEVKPGNRIYDISKAIEDSLKAKGYNPVKSLVGHGVGRQLHEEPQIPCFVYTSRLETPEITQGMTLAIEVMYTLGSSELVYDQDGWTISTADGKISGLFEETVAVGAHGPLVLTS